MRQPDRTGAALFTVMVIVLTVAVFTGTLVRVAMQERFMAGKLADRLRARAIAEAGVAHAYGTLCTNFDLRSNPQAFPEVPFGGGSFDVTVTPVGQDSALICSTGVYHSAKTTVIVDANRIHEGSPASGPAPGSAWEKTIYANGRMELKGNGDIDGALHANNYLTVNGNLEITPGPIDVTSSTKITVWGNVKTPGSLTAPQVHIDGNNESGATVTRTAVPLVSFPELDLLPYYYTALENNQVKSGRTWESDVDWSGVPGGVVWIEGNARFKCNVDFDGILIVTGSLLMEGNVNWDAPAGEAGTIISRDSYVDIRGNMECDGLVYCPGNISLWGNIRVAGQILGGSDVYIYGNVEQVHYAYSPVGTGTPGTPSTRVRITAWQK